MNFNDQPTTKSQEADRLIPFNLNGYVFVRLTPIGWDILRKHHNDLWERVPRDQRPTFEESSRKEKADGFDHYLNRVLEVVR